MKQLFIQLFGRITAAMYRQQALEQAQLDLVKAQIGLEHYRSLVAQNTRIIAKLKEGSAE